MELKSQVTREEHQYSWLCEHFRGLTALGHRGNCAHLRTVLTLMGIWLAFLCLIPLVIYAVSLAHC